MRSNYWSTMDKKVIQIRIQLATEKLHLKPGSKAREPLCFCFVYNKHANLYAQKTCIFQKEPFWKVLTTSLFPHTSGVVLRLCEIISQMFPTVTPQGRSGFQKQPRVLLYLGWSARGPVELWDSTRIDSQIRALIFLE